MTDRLGVAGFWGSEALERGNGLMNGIHDQIVALQWVHQHAALFGADPQQITIFVGHRRPLAAFLLRSALLDGCATARAQGESAGGQSTCALTVSPAAKGLFLRSIIESGACTGPWSPGTTTNGLAKSAALATSLHAPTSPMEQLAFMRKLDAKALFAASKGSFGAGSWAPDNGLVTTRRINMHDSPVGAVLPVARAMLDHAARLRWRASLPRLLPDAVAVGWIIWGWTSRALPPVLVYLRQRKQRSVSPRGPF